MPLGPWESQTLNLPKGCKSRLHLALFNFLLTVLEISWSLISRTLRFLQEVEAAQILCPGKIHLIDLILGQLTSIFGLTESLTNFWAIFTKFRIPEFLKRFLNL